mmetsp:Transcript_46567/g.107524  ORF Transcript_46567/g.107524 Transcript_46567/m.107524 type:complete len:268 (+) Transcript_46567:1009-1812(+)
MPSTRGVIAATAASGSWRRPRRDWSASGRLAFPPCCHPCRHASCHDLSSVSAPVHRSSCQQVGHSRAEVGRNQARARRMAQHSSWPPVGRSWLVAVRHNQTHLDRSAHSAPRKAQPLAHQRGGHCFGRRAVRSRSTVAERTSRTAGRKDRELGVVARCSQHKSRDAGCRNDTLDAVEVGREGHGRSRDPLRDVALTMLPAHRSAGNVHAHRSGPGVLGPDAAEAPLTGHTARCGIHIHCSRSQGRRSHRSHQQRLRKPCARNREGDP